MIGPSGSGKGSVAQLMAKNLGWHYLDSGAIYRVLAHAALKHNVDLANENRLSQLAKKLDLVFSFENDNLMVMLEGEDVSIVIRSEQTGNAASKIASLPSVRQCIATETTRFSNEAWSCYRWS